MTLRFACGHLVKVASNVTQRPVCPTCGEARIARVQTPPPTIRGTCTGPHAVTEALPAAIVNLCTEDAVPLVLKARATDA